MLQFKKKKEGENKFVTSIHLPFLCAYNLVLLLVNTVIVSSSELSVRMVVRAFQVLALSKSAFKMETTQAASAQDGTRKPHAFNK